MLVMLVLRLLQLPIPRFIITLVSIRKLDDHREIERAIEQPPKGQSWAARAVVRVRIRPTL